jgi:putative ABC transport system permease protein
VWLITFRDLQWRARRFAFGVSGTALVFAVTLLLAGLSSALHSEATRTVNRVGADSWLVKQGASGPFSALTAMPETIVSRAARAPGVRSADPLVMAFATTAAPHAVDVTVIGYRPGGLGPPSPAQGRAPAAPGEALVDSATGIEVGSSFALTGHQFTAVGQVHGMTLRGGVGNIYVPIHDAQAVLFGGNRIITTIVAKGWPTDPAALGLTAISPDAAGKDLLHLFSKGLQAIDLLRVLLWLVAAAIVGTVLYLSVLDRVQDFAVLKAIGVATGALVVSLALQAVLLSVLAAGVGIVMGVLIAPAFPMSISLGADNCAVLLAASTGVGLLAGVLGLRRAVAIDPAVAFGSG